MTDSRQKNDEESIPAKRKKLTSAESSTSSSAPNSRENFKVASFFNQKCNDISIVSSATSVNDSNYFIRCNIRSLTIIEDSTAKKILVKPDEIREILKDLQAKLCDRAKALYNTNLLKHPLNGQALNAVPLELTREVFSTQNTDLSELSKNVAQCKKANPSDTLSHKNLFEEASKLSETKTMTWNNTIERKNHKLIHGNIVGVIGPAGIGKTTWTTYIAKQCMKKQLYNTKFLFYIKFQDISFERDTTLLRLLLISSAFTPLWKDLNVDNAILDELDKTSDVLIIMDGLNEANYSKLSEPSSLVSLHSIAKPEELIKNLLCGNILPNSKKILTSRPRHMYELHLDYRPHFIVHARGIDMTSRKKICKEICKNLQRSNEEVFNCISYNSRILSYCENPLHCILVFECLKKQLEQTGELVDVAGSRTDLFLRVLEMFLHCDHTPGNLKSEKLYNLAWNAIAMQRFYFTASEIMEAEITNDLVATLFNIHVPTTPGQKVLDGSITYSFAHLIIAEFLAAVRLIRTKDVTEFCQSIFLLDKSCFETVRKFLFGLCHQKTLDRLGILGISTDFSRNDIRFRELKNFTLKTLTTSLENKRRDSLDVLLRICSCAYEMHDDEFACEVAQVLGNKLTVIENIFHSDIAGFCYVIKAKRSRAFELCLGPSIKFIGNSFCLFFERMYTIVHQSFIVMRSVDVSRNNIGNDEAKALARCLPYIGSLNISDCKLAESQVQIITNQILELEFLHEISFSYNELNDAAAAHIAQCLHKIDRLHVSMCGFSAAGIRTVSNAISHRQRLLEHFCCSGNITNEKLFLISHCVEKIEELFICLRNEKVNVVAGIEKLCNAIEGLAHPLQSLIILGSNIGDEGLLAISKCLKNIIKLRLGNGYDENLTSWGIGKLSAAFSKLQVPIKKFVFCCPNKLLAEIKVEFSFCKNNIEQLEIR